MDNREGEADALMLAVEESARSIKKTDEKINIHLSTMEHTDKVKFKTNKEYKILSSITFQDLREAIDELGLTSNADKTNQLVQLTVTNSNWKTEVIVHFVISDNWVRMYSFADFKGTDTHIGIDSLEQERQALLETINEYNRINRFVAAYIEDGIVFLERNIFADSLVEDGEKTYLPIGWDYFKKVLSSFVDVSAIFFSNDLFNMPNIMVSTE